MPTIYSPPNCVDDILFDMTYHKLDERILEHGHSCIEIVVIIGGTAVQVVDGVRSNVYPGCVTIIYPGCTHAFQEVNGCELYNISCRPNPFRAMGVSLSFLHNRDALFCSDRGSFSLYLSGVLFCDIQNLLHRMFRIHEDESASERHVQLRSLFGMLLILLAQSWSAKPARADRRLGETVEYMESHYNEALTLDQLAKRAGMSKNQFLRKFRLEFDTSPIQYLLELRMKRACILLEESDLTIDQIAVSTGFYDSNYFIKLYRKRFNDSPGKNRKK